MAEIERNGFNPNLSRYVGVAEAEPEVDLASTHVDLVWIEQAIRSAAAKHNAFLEELGLPALL